MNKNKVKTPEEQALYLRDARIRARMSGFDERGNPLSEADYRENVRLFEELLERQQRREHEEKKIQMQEQEQKLKYSVEEKKLLLEERRVENERAALMVRALEVAVSSGNLSGEALVRMLDGFRDRILPSLDQKQLTAKEE